MKYTKTTVVHHAYYDVTGGHESEHIRNEDWSESATFNDVLPSESDGRIGTFTIMVTFEPDEAL